MSWPRVHCKFPELVSSRNIHEKWCFSKNIFLNITFLDSGISSAIECRIVCVCRRCTGNVITCLDISKQTRLSLSILVGLSIIIDPTLNQCVMFPLNRFLIICHDKLLINLSESYL